MRLATLTSLTLLACSTAHAGVADPPSRVARIRSLAGITTIQDAGNSRPASATRNWPVAPGDRLRTEQDSRAELDFGNVTVDIDPSTDLTVEELKPGTTRLGIAAGSAHISTNGSLHETIGIRLANASIDISEPGDYRVTVRETGDAWMIVYSGEAKLSARQASFEQRSGEEVAIAREGTFAIAPAPAANDVREHFDPQPKGVRTAQHVAPDLVGYRDLDDYGVWRWIPEYGMVWEPLHVPSEWAPYRFGHWIWKSPWGWTWVDDAPWGFTPFHFGRWAYHADRWVWVPGPRQIPAAYAPALVRWVTEPASREPVDWYPLAPGETYVPPYPATALHKRSVNLFAVPAAVRR